MLTHLQTGTAEKSGLAFISLQFLTRYLLIHWKKTTWHLVCRKYSPIRDMQSGVHAGEIWQHCTGWGIVLDQCFQGTSSPPTLFRSSSHSASQKSVPPAAFYLFQFSGLLYICSLAICIWLLWNTWFLVYGNCWITAWTSDWPSEASAESATGAQVEATPAVQLKGV